MAQPPVASESLTNTIASRVLTVATRRHTGAQLRASMTVDRGGSSAGAARRASVRLVPVGAGADVGAQRHAQLSRSHHALAHRLGHLGDALGAYLEDPLVVHLHDE